MWLVCMESFTYGCASEHGSYCQRADWVVGVLAEPLIYFILLIYSAALHPWGWEACGTDSTVWE